MTDALRRLLLLLTFAAVWPSVAQEMEHPPPPKAAPRPEVAEMALPSPGGVMVFGASGPLGVEIARALTEQTVDVKAMVRRTSQTAVLEELGIDLFQGDAMTKDDVTRSLRAGPVRAVISVLGGRGGDYRVDIGGNVNVINATREVGISRFILVTAIGAGESAAAAPWYIRWFMGRYFEAKTAAEIALKNSGFDYTIVRPGWLLDGEPTGAAQLVGDPGAFSWITRADLGGKLAEIVEDEATYGKALTAYDPELTGILSIFH